jgi:hypothetical protein
MGDKACSLVKGPPECKIFPENRNQKSRWIGRISI